MIKDFNECNEIVSDPSVKPGQKSRYSIDEVAQIYGINPWTVRMWIDWFDIRQYGKEDTMLLTSEAVERIGIICRLSKIKGMKLGDVQKHLESGERGMEVKNCKEK